MKLPFIPESGGVAVHLGGTVRRRSKWHERWPSAVVVLVRATLCFSVTTLPLLVVAAVGARLGLAPGAAAFATVVFGWLVALAHQATRRERIRRIAAHGPEIRRVA